MADLLEVAKSAAEKIPAVMEGPASDWVPVLLYEDGRGHFHPAALPNLTRENLAAAAEWVRDVLVQAHAVQATLTLTTIVTEMGKDGAQQSERVMITHVWGNHTRIEVAQVLRGKSVKPRLGPWSRMESIGSGPFVDAMREAIGR